MTTTPKPTLPEPFADEVFAGDGPATRRLRLQVARMAPHYRIALLQGERACGKLTVACEMHRLGPVSQRPFVLCAAAELLDTTRQLASAGTLYLYGIDGLPLELQRELPARLRSLPREVRIIASSTSDLRGLVAAGRMHADLFEAVATLEIRLLPLRERPEELDGLAASMLARVAPKAWLGGAAQRKLAAHTWPGNLAELWQILAPLRGRTQEIAADDLALPWTAPHSSSILRLDEVMQRHVLHVLERCAGNKLKAAEVLGISRSTLYRMLEP